MGFIVPWMLESNGKKGEVEVFLLLDLEAEGSFYWKNLWVHGKSLSKTDTHGRTEWDVCTWTLSSRMCCGWILTSQGSNDFWSTGWKGVATRRWYLRGNKGKQVWRCQKKSVKGHLACRVPFPIPQRTWACCWETVGKQSAYLFFQPPLQPGRNKYAMGDWWDSPISIRVSLCSWDSNSLCSLGWLTTLILLSPLSVVIIDTCHHTLLWYHVLGKFSQMQSTLLLVRHIYTLAHSWLFLLIFALKTHPSYLLFLLNVV